MSILTTIDVAIQAVIVSLRLNVRGYPNKSLSLELQVYRCSITQDFVSINSFQKNSLYLQSLLTCSLGSSFGLHEGLTRWLMPLHSITQEIPD